MNFWAAQSSSSDMELPSGRNSWVDLPLPADMAFWSRDDIFLDWQPHNFLEKSHFRYPDWWARASSSCPKLPRWTPHTAWFSLGLSKYSPKRSPFCPVPGCDVCFRTRVSHSLHQLADTSISRDQRQEPWEKDFFLLHLSIVMCVCL